MFNYLFCCIGSSTRDNRLEDFPSAMEIKGASASIPNTIDFAENISKRLEVVPSSTDQVILDVLCENARENN